MSRNSNICIFVVLLGLTAFFPNVVHSEAIDMLERYQWKQRLFVIFATSSEDHEFKKQQESIEKQQRGVVDREIVVLTILADKSRPILDGENVKFDGTSLRALFKVPQNQFRSFLIGKDGGIKLTKSSAVNVCDLFELIDRMPMRRQEMSAKGTSVSCG